MFTRAGRPVPSLGLLLVGLVFQFALAACGGIEDDVDMVTAADASPAVDVGGGIRVDAEAPPDAGWPSGRTCADRPRAYVFDHVDPITGVVGAADRLRAAGFVVEPLPLDRSPATLTGVVFIASFASESADYARYMTAYAGDLRTFVGLGNTLVQMAQRSAVEATPPFLPTGLLARRHDADLTVMHTFNRFHPMMRGIPVHFDSGSWEIERQLKWRTRSLAIDAFAEQEGFEVLLAEGSGGKVPAVMEAAVGDGRILLVSMNVDKAIATSPEREAFTVPLFANLREHARDVCRGTASAPRVMPRLAGPIFAPDSWVIAVLPDTQYYTQSWPQTFDAQTAWIAKNAARLKISYVLHLGDIVDQNNAPQWTNAARSMSALDGVVPYALVGGNHDYGPGGNATTRDTLMNTYFPYDKQVAWPTFGGAYEFGKIDNTYHLFSAGGRDYIVIALEWGPRDEVVAWANGVMRMYPDRRGFLVTHAYTNWNDFRYDFRDKSRPQDYNPHVYGTPGSVNDGEELWTKLVSQHRFSMVFSGHVLADGTGYLVSTTNVGNRCHQMLSNYQMRAMGGLGYMRLVEFTSDGQAKVYTYSPALDEYNWDFDQFFSFSID